MKFVPIFHAIESIAGGWGYEMDQQIEISIRELEAVNDTKMCHQEWQFRQDIAACKNCQARDRQLSLVHPIRKRDDRLPK